MCNSHLLSFFLDFGGFFFQHLSPCYLKFFHITFLQTALYAGCFYSSPIYGHKLLQIFTDAYKYGSSESSLLFKVSADFVRRMSHCFYQRTHLKNGSKYRQTLGVMVE